MKRYFQKLQLNKSINYDGEESALILNNYLTFFCVQEEDSENGTTSSYKAIIAEPNESNDEGNKKNVLSVKKGLGLMSASAFIVGEMAGSGILALPKAVAETGDN